MNPTIEVSIAGKKAKFSNIRLPDVDERIYVNMNNLGWGIVKGYKIFPSVSGLPWAAVNIELEHPPEWYVKQNNGNVPAVVFGEEILVMSHKLEKGQNLGDILLSAAARNHANHRGAIRGGNFVECVNCRFHAHLDPSTGDKLWVHWIDKFDQVPVIDTNDPRLR